jgi:hypothetical protein
VYELVLQLQTHEEELHARSLSELQALTRLEELVEERGEVGQFGTSTHEEELNKKRSQDFTQRYITSVRTQLRVLNKSYQVKYFIHIVSSYPLNKFVVVILLGADCLLKCMKMLS